MKFEVPKITRAIKLAEYAPEFGDVEIQVWVNPPKKLLEEHDQVVQEVKAILANPLTLEEAKPRIERAAEETARIISELWSQGPAETRWTAEEIRRLVKEKEDTDPDLWPWLRERTIEEIRNHRAGIKKG